MIKFKDYPSGYKVRAFGWVQDAADFGNLHRFVSLFYEESLYKEILKQKIIDLVVEEKKEIFLEIISRDSIEISYKNIVGTSPKGSRRTETKCNGLGQVALKGQKRDFQGDWPTDNFLRWAEVLQFIKYDVLTDEYCITNVGKSYASAIDVSEQETIIAKQLLMYSPAKRILACINQEKMSKFRLGEKLGFIGEKGFTYVTEELFIEIYQLADEDERRKMKSDFEGSSDKYARQICSWLGKLGLIVTQERTIEGNGNSLKLSEYNITAKGKVFLRKSNMKSKYVPFGMLSMETKNKEMHCKRRALVLMALTEGKSSLTEIMKTVSENEISTFERQIKDDLDSFINIGLEIEVDNDCYRLKDKIDGLYIPNKIEISLADEAEKLKNHLRENLVNINHDLLNIIDYSYSKKASRFFEVYVAKAFKMLSDKTYLLGGPSKPDVVSAICDTTFVIDAKAYKEGFTLPIGEQDKMVRYIEEYKVGESKWVLDLASDDAVLENKAFLFVSSGFGTNTENKLLSISERTGVSGSAITASSLLQIVDNYIKTGNVDINLLKSNQVISSDMNV